MTDWIILAVFFVGAIVTARKATMALLNGPFDSGQTDDAVMARMVGFSIGLFWPAILIGAVVTGRLPKTDRQLRDTLRQRETRIRELERELGIGQK